MPVQESVSADVDEEINAFWKPQLHVAVRKIHGSVVNVCVLGDQLNLGDRFQQVELHVSNLEVIARKPRASLELWKEPPSVNMDGLKPRQLVGALLEAQLPGGLVVPFA